MIDNLIEMASVYNPNTIETLWNEIMKVHWKFLDAEESLDKINLRKQLEELIFQYLCNITPDRKFLLSSTVHVLKSSIAKLEDFSAYKASIGFEAISQYANNLFTKPWRKEYKTIKMYSGFYQHEIAANLVNAERLFQELGYQMMPDQTLILEEPICPDRVTNVSRDAITANVECQIMRDIYRKLSEMSLDVNWSDIYSFRECNNNIYGSRLPPAVNSCNSCNVYPFPPSLPQQQSVLPPPLMVMHHPQQATTPFCTQPLYNATPCSTHNQQPKLAYGFHPHHPTFLPTSPTQVLMHPSHNSVNPPHPQPPLSAMLHSKSLDHYQEPAAAMYNLTACMQRHSIDQPPFDYAAGSSASHYGGPMGMAPPTGNYDAIDSCNMVYNNHSYNVSGNRFPLPYNFSTNMNPCMNGKPSESYYHQPSISYVKQIPDPYYQHHQRSTSNGELCTQQNHPPRHSSDIYINHNFDHNSTETHTPSILSRKKSLYDAYDVPPVRKSSINEAKQSTNDLICLDTREKNKQERKKVVDRNVRPHHNDLLLVDYDSEMLPDALVKRNHQHHVHHNLHHQVSRNSRQSDFDSCEEDQLQTEATQRASNVNKRMLCKDQEGIGSYETWNYVFRNLEKQGYSKDLGERGDLLGNTERDEFSATANNCSISRGSTLKRNSNDKLKAMKPKSADKIDGIRSTAGTVFRETNSTKHDRENEFNELVAHNVQKPSSVHKLPKSTCNNHTDNNHRRNHIDGNSNSNLNGNGSSNNMNVGGKRNTLSRKLSASTKETSTTANNATISSGTSTSGGILLNHNNNMSHHPESEISGNNRKSTSFEVPVNQTVASSVHLRSHGRTANTSTVVSEWNCKFCTYLNPNSTRVCEMCCKTRNLDVNGSGGATNAPTSNGAATCV